MARTILGSLLDREFRNELNRMLLELYEGINTASGTKNKIDAFLDGTGVVSRKMLANNSVDTTKIADGAVNNSKIADGAVDELKIADGSVSTNKMKNSSVNTDKIDNGAVTHFKLGASSVTNEKIRNGAVRDQHIEDYSLSPNKISPSLYTNIFDITKVVSGGINDSGVIFESATASTSDFMPVIGGEYLNAPNGHGAFVVFDSNKDVIEYKLASTKLPYLLPDTAKYVRMSMLTTSIPGRYVYLGKNTIPYIEFGVTYDAALEKRFNTLEKITNDVRVERGTQLFNKKNITPNHSIDQSTGELVESNDFYTSNFIPVIPGEHLMILPTIGQSAFYDIDYNYISGFNSLTGNPVEIPSNAYYLRTSGFITSLETKMVYVGTEELPYQEYNAVLVERFSLLERLINEKRVEKNTQLFDKNSVTMDYSVDMQTGELVENPDFYVSEFIPVLPNEKLMVLPTIGQSAFYDIDYNFISGFNSLTGNPVEIPSNAYYLVTSGFIASLDTKMVYIGTEELPYQEYGGGTSQTDVFSTNQLSFNADGFPLISTPYDSTSNIEYTFGQLGINEFYHLQRIKTDYFNQLVSSDHISPYRIRAVNSPIAENSIIVTGGNHGSDGGGGGFPTGRPISIDVYIDNKKITSGMHNTNSPIVVKVINEACAYNTVNTATGERRDVLREIITYTFYPNVQTVSIDMEALEPIEFYGHRGISMQRHNHKQFAYVPTDSSGQVNAGGAFDFRSTSEGSDGDRIVQYNADNHLAVMFLDERFGVGDFELNAVDPRWFMSAGKTYSNTIEQEKYHPVAANEILTLSGGYHFGKSLAMPGNGKAYHIIRGGKRVYCADDFFPRSGYVEVLPEDVNKEVKVIKNVGYTVDGFTTSKGLKFSKTSGAGTLIFEVI